MVLYKDNHREIREFIKELFSVFYTASISGSEYKRESALYTFSVSRKPI